MPNAGVGFRLPRIVSWALIGLSMLAPILTFHWATRLAHRRGRSATTPRALVGMLFAAAVVVNGPIAALALGSEITDSRLTAVALVMLGWVTAGLALIYGVQAILPHRSLPPPNSSDRVG